ncbi:uncharacterized protein L201_005544 [Kwoniella dendrophila CBS 6074]|uniref:F-box domain-containing protein n=1 Tax=Kwoniella dendrophila CBS 6074 TaxID=1295534 RepID=A0AAX4K0F9_9TREE
MSASPTSALLTHPDILTHILSFADKSSLSRCMQVSWSFFQLASPLLYREITLIPDEADSIFKGASTGLMIYSDLSEREMKRDLLSNVRILNIKEHDNCNGFNGTSACTRWRGIGIEFDNLEILKIWVPSNSRYMGNWWNCPWIPNFQNYGKLVVRNVNHLSCNAPYTIVPDRMKKNIFKLVITIKNMVDLREMNERVISSTISSPTEDHLGTNTDIVVIFWIDKPGQTWCCNNNDKSLNLNDIDNLIEQISICALVRTKRLIICNLDKISILDKKPKEVEEYLQNGFKELIQAMSTSRREHKQIENRLQAIEYMTFEQYLAEEDWKGEFDIDELQPWLSISDA